ncbi:21012_t:CDS:2, partial [Cetraspora pellucida]
SILIRLEYQVELSDYDWIIAKRHKLILLVYAILDVQESRYRHTNVVTYLDLIFIRVCSSKHDSSITYSHACSLLLTNSGPDKNPRYKKTVQMMIEHFDTYDFDTIIVAYFAPYQNAQLRTNNKELEKCNFKVAGDVLASI